MRPVSRGRVSPQAAVGAARRPEPQAARGRSPERAAGPCLADGPTGSCAVLAAEQIDGAPAVSVPTSYWSIGLSVSPSGDSVAPRLPSAASALDPSRGVLGAEAASDWSPLGLMVGDRGDPVVVVPGKVT